MMSDNPKTSQLSRNTKTQDPVHTVTISLTATRQPPPPLLHDFKQDQITESPDKTTQENIQEEGQTRPQIHSFTKQHLGGSERLVSAVVKDRMNPTVGPSSSHDQQRIDVLETTAQSTTNFQSIVETDHYFSEDPQVYQKLANPSDGGVRKCSLIEGEDEESCEEVKTQEEQDNRCSINKKLIKNNYVFSKNNFRDYNMAAKEEERQPRELVRHELHQSSHNAYRESQDQQDYVMILDKRCRSETPNKMSATDVLLRAQQKIHMRQRESPAKLMEQLQQRQKKAEEVRSQIENTKKKWYEKIRKRQQGAKEKWEELLAQRKRNLKDKLEQAEERRETEIEILRNKAKQEIQKIDETNFIMKMTMNNMKLDINLKMSETQERRNMIMEENKRKHHDRHLKEEAAEKRRQQLIKEQENKVLKQKQKFEQAQQRRIQMLEQRKTAAYEYQKRNKVLQRKNDLDKISDVMSFVNNSEFIWDCLANMNDWEDFGLNDQDDLLFELISKDQFEIQKLRLKHDAELLNKIIFEGESGKMYARQEYLPLINKINRRRHNNQNYLVDDSSSEPSSEEEAGNNTLALADLGENAQQHQISSPLNYVGTKLRQTPPRMKNDLKHLNEGGDFQSENSIEKEDSIPEESILRALSEDKSLSKDHLEEDQQFEPAQIPSLAMTDEYQNYMLYQIRLKMSMKRNVLKKSLSEDLTWADFLKNDNFTMHNPPSGFMNQHGRSLYSTPERKSEIPQESEEKEDMINQNISIVTNQSVPVPKRSHGRRGGKHHKKSQSSRKHPHSTQNSFIGTQGVASSLPQLIQGSHNSGTLSDKQTRLSSVVYPSSKKKNPLNERQMMSQTIGILYEPQQQQHNIFGALKAKGSMAGSNTSSTHSLLLIHQVNTDTPRDLLAGLQNINVNQGRKSLILDTDSGRKKQCSTARLSTLEGIASVVPQNIFSSSFGNQSILTTQMDMEEKSYFDSQNNAFSHTGTHMNQLLTNSKPLLPVISKTVPKKLTANANKILFPLVSQKLLLKRPGKDGQFGKFKINLRLEELTLNKVPHQILNQTSHLTASLLQTSATHTNSTPIEGASTIKMAVNDFQVKLDDFVLSDNDPLISSSRQENQIMSESSTPINRLRKDSNESNNSITLHALQNEKQVDNSTPTTTTSGSKLIQVQQKFLEKLQSSQQQVVTSNQLQNSGQPMLEQSNNLLKKKQALPLAQDRTTIMEVSQAVDKTPSPKKDTLSITKRLEEGLIISQFQQENISNINLNDQNIKDQLVKCLLIENIQHLKLEDNQKTIFLEGEEANKLIDFLETNELNIRYCRLCESIVPESQTNEFHAQTKSHKKTRDELQIKDFEDWQLSLLVIHSAPGDIEKELLKEKEKALKRKVKRIKAQMIAQAVNHEVAASCPGKDFLSANKKRCQILCIDLEKQVIPIIKDYDALENSLKELIKILDMRKQADLHLMRKLKFIPILIEICKRISVCHKNEFRHLGKVLEFVIKIINTFCSLRENRNYMLQTNRLSALIELLNWCLNRPTQLFYGINFVPQIFHILTLHVKHRAPYECQQMKEMFIEYLISSQITMKIKGKFQIINGPLDLSEMMGQVPLFLLKSATFLESLTNLIQMDAMTRPVHEKSEKIGEHVYFVTQNTDIFGIPQMIATILLSRNQPFKLSQSSLQNGNQKVLPQTILSLAITSVKILNNVFRMDYRFAQQTMSEFEIQEHLYLLFNFILYYAVETLDKQEDSKELLHETILMIGYFCLNNEKNQALLCKGESTIIQKLCALPIAYFHDKRLKDILFPTLIQASYKNERSLAIMDQEISIDMIVNFIQANNKEELPRIMEEENDYQSMSSMSHSAAAFDRRSHRSPSISSTNSSQQSLQIDMATGNSPFVPLYMRFPRKYFKDAIQFYSQVLY